MSANSRVTIGIILLAVGALLVLQGCRNPREDYKPEQPIPFDHYIHAGQFEIDCQYCHVSPAAGRHSTVPSMQICMNCHATVMGTTAEAVKNLNQLRDMYGRGEPLEWVKVHDLPDYVFYDHKPHIAKGLDCTECHGKVEEAKEIGVQNEFNMGWCVNCHRTSEPPAPINCTTCHR